MPDHIPEQLLSATARQVVQSLAQRRFDDHRVFHASLLSHIFCHELLASSPDLKSRLWSGYRPWPDESSESICFWIEGGSSQPAIGIEIVADDPADKSRVESAGVWGGIIADVFKLATAMAHRGLDAGYVILFGELNFDESDKRVAQFPLTVDGQSHSIKTREWLTSSMDTSFFEELMHPHESTPPIINLQLLARETEQRIGFCLWSIKLPDNHH